MSSINFPSGVSSSKLLYTPDNSAGYLGLSPLKDDDGTNFMDEIIKEGYILERIFAIKLNGNNPHIKFGGYDNNLSGGEEFRFIRTSYKDTWDLNLDSIHFGDSDLKAS